MPEENETMTTAQNQPSNSEKFARGLKMGATAAASLIAGKIGAKMLFGRTGAFVAGSTLAGGSSSDEQSPQPMGFSDIAGSTVGQAASVATPTTGKTFFGSPTSAKNSGRSKGINKADVLESSSDNLNDIENVLLDIRDDIRQVVSNTKEKVEKPKETSEESIRAGFANSKLSSIGRAGALGGLGMAGLLGLGATSDTEDKKQQISNIDASKADFGSLIASDGLPGGALITTPAALLQKKSVKDIGKAAVRAVTVNTPPSGAPGGPKPPSKVTPATPPRNFSMNAAGQPVSNKTGRVLSGAARNTALATAASDAAAAGGNVGKGVIAQAVTKVIGKQTAAIVGKMVPWAGTIIGVGDAFWRLFEGDFTGAGVSTAGALGALVPGYGIPIQVGTIATNLARDVYKDVYEVFPEDDPDPNVAEKYGRIYDELKSQIMELLKEQSELEKAMQKENLQSAVDSGLYNDRAFLADTVEESKIADAKTGELQAILKKDDISRKNKALITAELEKRGQVTSASPEQVQPRVDSNQVSSAMEEEESAREGNNQPIIIDNSTNTGGTGGATIVEAPVVNVNIGNTMMTPAQGSARFVSEAIGG